MVVISHELRCFTESIYGVHVSSLYFTESVSGIHVASRRMKRARASGRNAQVTTLEAAFNQLYVLADKVPRI